LSADFVVLHSPAEWRERFGDSGPTGTTLSVGNFDGLHLGHQKIIRAVVEKARATSTVAAVVTFDPHPLKVLRPAEAPALVETLPQRIANFKSMGLDAVLVLHFDLALAAVTAQEFVRGVLVDQLRAATILVGQTFRFGYQNAGDVALLAEMGREFKFDVEIIPPVLLDGLVVSSTAVRRAILDGCPGEATRLLGRSFSLTGTIVRGAGRGSTITVPTLNLAPEQELLPKTGVYATEVLVAGRVYGAATNVGFRPTFDGDGTRLSIESHLFDFSERLTEGRLEVRFLERLRDERKFAGPQELVKQISADLEQARKFLQQSDPTQRTRQHV
jgi:riboflavin kinase/FMN adenylyltransferase